MASTQTLIDLIKAELKTAGISYAQLARELELSESSVKRMFAAGGEMPLSRIDELCRVLKTDFAELSQRLSRSQSLRLELTLQQEKEVVADEKLLLMAICCLSQWSYEQIVATYRLSEADATRAMAHLDRLGIIELRPMNRYRLQVAKTFRWRPHGPVMQFFREHVVLDYYRGGFDGPAEGLLLVHGSISRALAPAFLERLQRVAQDFAQQHQTDQKLSPDDREGYTLLLGMRNWEFELFTQLRRGELSASRRDTAVRHVVK